VHYALPFRIQNAEPASRRYRWSVLIVQHPGRARLIATRTADVGPGKTAPIPLAGLVNCAHGKQVEFIVQLAGQRPPEAIHARATCPQHRD
jgi:hypothetical protein